MQQHRLQLTARKPIQSWSQLRFNKSLQIKVVFFVAQEHLNCAAIRRRNKHEVVFTLASIQTIQTVAYPRRVGTVCAELTWFRLTQQWSSFPCSFRFRVSFVHKEFQTPTSDLLGINLRSHSSLAFHLLTCHGQDAKSGPSTFHWSSVTVKVSSSKVSIKGDDMWHPLPVITICADPTRWPWLCMFQDLQVKRIAWEPLWWWPLVCRTEERKDSRVHCLLFTFKATNLAACHQLNSTSLSKLIPVSAQNRKVFKSKSTRRHWLPRCPSTASTEKLFPRSEKKLDRSSRILLNKCKQNSGGILPTAKSTSEIGKTQALDYSK